MSDFTIDGHRVILNDLDAALPLLESERELAVDTETTGFSPWRNDIALVQVYGDETGVLYVQQVQDGLVPRPLIKILSNPAVRLTGHNLVMFDAIFLERQGVDLQAVQWYDTLVAETMLTPMGRKDVSKKLGATLRRRLGVDIDKDIEHGAWALEELSDEQLTYAAQDVLHLHALRRAQQSLADDSEERGALDMEMDLVPYVAMMTVNGLPVHEARMRKYLEDQERLRDETMAKLEDQLGKFNINSPKQIKGVFADLGIRLANTQRDTFIEMARGRGKGAELAQMMLDVKLPVQRIKMYGGGKLNEIIVDDRVHAKFWQCGTDTLRFASSEPNLQQWPKDMRYMVGGFDGRVVVAPDYKQIEVCVAAYLAKDQEMLRILNSDADVHTAIASTIFRIPEDQVDDDLRRDSKEFTFKLLFGGGASSIHKAAQLKGSDLSFNEVQEAVRQFFGTFTGIRQVRESADRYIRGRGARTIRLPNGARRILVGPKKRLPVLINTTVQGGASVGLKRGMLEAGRQGLFEYIGAQVHDELVAEVPEAEAEEFAAELTECMVQGMEETFPGMPVEVGANIGTFWK